MCAACGRSRTGPRCIDAHSHLCAQGCEAGKAAQSDIRLSKPHQKRIPSSSPFDTSSGIDLCRLVSPDQPSPQRFPSSTGTMEAHCSKLQARCDCELPIVTEEPYLEQNLPQVGEVLSNCKPSAHGETPFGVAVVIVIAAIAIESRRPKTNAPFAPKCWVGTTKPFFQLKRYRDSNDPYSGRPPHADW